MDEFGLPSTYQTWVPESLIRLILMEKKPQFANIPIEIHPPEDEKTIVPAKDTLLIDMRKISTFK